mgnify:CR=1 FL=1
MIEIPLISAVNFAILYSKIHRPAGPCKNIRELSQFSAIPFDSKRDSDPEAEMLQNLKGGKV